MKKTFLLFFTIIIASALSPLFGQISVPKLSPFQKTEIKIGMVEVVLEYSRPSMRGRKIFGDLVPYGKIWRTGANKNTKIVFKDKVLIGNQELKAGTYSVFTKPNQDKWDIYFHTELDQYGIGETLDPKNIVAQVSIPVVQLERDLESLSITFDNLTTHSAILGIAWERTYIPIPIKIPTNDIIQDKLFEANTNLAGNYESAAWTYYEYEKDYKSALIAIDKCISIMEKEEPFEVWLKGEGNLDNPNRPRRYLTKSEIHDKLGETAQAIKAAKKSLEIAEKINAKRYIKINTENLKKWTTNK